MDRELAELRRAVGDLGPKRAGRRIPAGLRTRLVTLVRERRRGGGPACASSRRRWGAERRDADAVDFG